MKNLFVLLFLLIGLNIQAQDVAAETPVEKEMTLEEHELSLIGKLNDIISQPYGEFRDKLNQAFIPALVSALKSPNSFEYPFDKLEGVSTVIAPDNSFRIFTWAIPEGDQEIGDMPSEKFSDDQSFRYYGAIQMNSTELKLTPLFDKSRELIDPTNMVLDNENWYGCIYYKIAQKEFQNKTYYTVFGWDGNNEHSDRKIADALHFENEKALFGAPIFEVRGDSSLLIQDRFIMEYKEGSGVSLNYDEELDAIIFDFIAPQTIESKGAYGTYIPDGTYDGMIFENGVWAYKGKIYDYLGISEDVNLGGQPSLNLNDYRDQPKSKKDKKLKGQKKAKRVNPWDRSE